MRTSQNYTFHKARNDQLRELWKLWIRTPEMEYPRELDAFICGAKTRKGTPCKRRDLYASGRCQLHGGLSTGPRTKEGKKRSSQNWKGSK